MSISADWIVGFCDGEAAFQVTIQTRKRTRKFHVEIRFTIGLGDREHECLEAIKAYFGVGQIIRRNLEYIRQQGIGSKDQWHYVVRGCEDCSVIASFFKKNPLKTSKLANFEIWSTVLELIKHGRHLQIAGLLEIAKLRDQMMVKTRDYRYRDCNWFLEHYGLKKKAALELPTE